MSESTKEGNGPAGEPGSAGAGGVACGACGKACKLLAGLERCVLRPFTLLGVRLLWGCAFMIAGWGKLHHLDKVTQFFASLQIPAPHFHAVFVGCVEFFGGLLITLGLGTRVAALLLVGVMVGAIHFSDHVAFFAPEKEKIAAVATEASDGEDVPPAIFDDPGAVIAVKPVSYLAVSLLLLAFGPGCVSADALIKRRCGKRGKKEAKAA